MTQITTQNLSKVNGATTVLSQKKKKKYSRNYLCHLRNICVICASEQFRISVVP